MKPPELHTFSLDRLAAILLLIWAGMLSGQSELKFRYEVNVAGALSSPVTIKVAPVMVYETTGLGKNERNITTSSLEVVDRGSSYLRLDFRSDDDLLHREDVTFQVEAGGAVVAGNPEEEVRIGTGRNHIDFRIVGEGTATVKIKVVATDLGKVKLDDGYNQLTFTYDVLAFVDAYARAMAISETRMKAKVAQLATLYERFPSFVSQEYDNVENVGLVRDGLTRIREELETLNSRYETTATRSGAPFSAAWDYYRIFGEQRSPIVEKYATSATQALSQADDRYWARVDKGTISGLESYLAILDETPGYTPRHQQEARSAISSRIDALVSSAQECDEISSLVMKLKATQYYLENSSDRRFIALEQKLQDCGGPSCEDLYQDAISRKTRSACVTFLNTCGEDASTEQLNRVRSILEVISNCDRCRSQYQTILSDTANLVDYKALIQDLQGDCSACLSQQQRDQLLEWQSAIAPIVVKDNEGPIKGATDTEYFYYLTFSSGKGIEIYRLDGQSDSLFLEKALGTIIRKEWVEPDSILKITVLDGKEHDLTMMAASGDTISLNFKREPFSVRMEEGEQYLVFNMAFGDGPYILELQKGSELRFIPMPGEQDTVHLDSLLAKGFDGSYTLAVRDFYSRRYAFEGGESITLEQPLRASLWMWLILPLLAMIGLLISRNITSGKS